MKQHGWIVVLGILMTAYLVWAGCNGGHAPVDPMPLPDFGPLVDETSDTPSWPDPTPDRVILGSWSLSVNPDGTCSVRPNRTAGMHIDVTERIFPPACDDCVTAESIASTEDGLMVRISLKNPTNFTGYDVRAVILDTRNSSISTPPDSWTGFDTVTTEELELNPFYIFDSGVGLNEWAPGATGSREITIMHGISEISNVDFIIDASYPENQTKPPAVSNAEFSGAWIHSDGSDSIGLSCYVKDWQNDVTSVTADLSAIGGESQDMVPDPVNGHYYLGGISCTRDVEPGLKTVLITAESGGHRTYNRIFLFVLE